MTDNRFNRLVAKDAAGTITPKEREQLVQAALRRADYEHLRRHQAELAAIEAAMAEADAASLTPEESA